MCLLHYHINHLICLWTTLIWSLGLTYNLELILIMNHSESSSKTVLYVLIHGLTPLAMPSTMAGFIMELLSKGVEGKHILSLSYNPRNKVLAQVVRDVDKQLQEKIEALNLQVGDVELRIVGHSLGGILARCLDRGSPYDITRIWQIASPNKGAYWIDEVPMGYKLARMLFGDNIAESLRPERMIYLMQHYRPEDYIQAKAANLPICHDINNLVTGKQFTIWNPMSWLLSASLDEGHDGFVPVGSMHDTGIKVAYSHSDHLGVIANPEVIKYIIKDIIK